MKSDVPRCLSEFRRVYSELLTAAERLRVALDIQAGGFENLPADLARIIAIVSDTFGVSVTAMLSSGRSAPVARARQVAMILAADYTSYNDSTIAGYFGRDHAVIWHSRRVINDAVATDPTFAAQMKQLTGSVRRPVRSAA